MDKTDVSLENKLLKYNCVYCANHDTCDLEDMKDHAYNLRDGTEDCFVRSGKRIPPWFDPATECYGCMNHSFETCGGCKK